MRDVVDESWAYANNVFTQDECDKIIEYGNSLLPKPATIRTEISSGQDLKYRSSKVSWFSGKSEQEQWIYRKCCSAISNINDSFFKYDLTYIEDLQFTVYDVGGFYAKHVDYGTRSYGTRKLSFSILLNSVEEFSGGELTFHTSEYSSAINKTRSAMIAFPSYTLHEVTPVTDGVRYALVGWCVGPAFR